MSKSRIVLGGLLAIAAALPLFTAPKPAQARVFFGVGIGVPFYAPYYYPPPAYYYPPPVVYAPPPVSYAPAPVIARCVTPTFSCPLHYSKPVGAACGCPDAAGRLFNGRAG